MSLLMNQLVGKALRPVRSFFAGLTCTPRAAGLKQKILSSEKERTRHLMRCVSYEPLRTGQRVSVVPTIVFVSAAMLFGQNSVSPGALSAPYPTISNLAVEWLITGDDNFNAACAVQFRKQGSAAWCGGMPLKRVAAGQSRETEPLYSWPNKFSGSLLNLQPHTAYEIRLSLADPDGGGKDTTITAATRPVPRTTSACEIINVPDGNNGSLTVTADGTSGRPKVYRSLSHKAIYSTISINNRKWVYLEGLTVNGSITMREAQNCAIKRCSVTVSFTDNGRGAIDGQLGITNCCIADNYVKGPVQWIASEMGASGESMTEGIQITGCGNVIRNNYVTGFHDCLSHMEDDEVSSAGQICNDWCCNDVFSGLDDGIEADFAFNNCRVMENRFTDCFNAMSSQPSLGGPTYFIRNVVFNAAMGSFKLNRFSVGDVILHNTIVKAGDGLCTFDSDPFDWAIWKNNLALGGTNGGWTGSQVSGGYGPGSGYACNISACGSHCVFDYDAVGTYKTAFAARINGRDFFTVEPHGRKIDSSAFPSFRFPSPPAPGPAYYYQPQDLRPSPSCTSIVDKALAIPNINDDFSGAGPDIGAYEAGRDLPAYGPRPQGVDEQTPFESSSVAAPQINRAPPSPRLTVHMSPNASVRPTRISIFSGLSGKPMSVFIADASGRRIRSLYSGTTRPVVSLEWNGKSSAGQPFSPGVYYLFLTMGKDRLVQRMLLYR